ncbi:MAG: DJ-1/PfpI family protein [Flavonifractor plautii]
MPACLLLTGGTAWLERKNDAVLPVVRELVRCHIPVAAICNAVNFLAENGFLDQRRHTGNTLPFLKSQAPHYKGRHISLRRRRFVTTAFLPPTDSERWSWQKRYCGSLKFRSEQELAEWYAWNKFGLYSPGHKGVPQADCDLPGIIGWPDGQSGGGYAALKREPG